MKKAFLASIIAMFAMGACLVLYLYVVMPRQRPPSDEVVNVSPERVARGRYLAEHVVLCNDCHSERDWTLYGGPPKPPLGAGRECMTRETKVAGVMTSEGNFPGILCIRNITPDPETGIGEWTDGELIRAMREGVGRHGRGLFPIMPYFIFRRISDEDARALVAYMRSLPPIREERRDKEIDFPMNLMIQLWPETVRRTVKQPDEGDSIRYGSYLATIGRCEYCHTPRRWQGGRYGEPGKRFAGGVPFALNGKVMHSKNLTAHEDGLKSWTREAFIARFKAFNEPHKVAPEDNTLMNWSAYSGMSEEDLGSIYDFLMFLPPVASEPIANASE
jgi:mono/diheme cytochrome c family protein